MNTTETPRGQRADDARPPAVCHAEMGAAAWRAAVDYQLAATPDHADFYALAGDLVETLRALDTVAGVLASQATSYGASRQVYDDEDANPAHRLRAAVLALAETRHGLARAERAANQFWSAIGHIGTRYQDGDRS